MVKEIKQASKSTKEFVLELIQVAKAILMMLPVASAIYCVIYVQENVTGFAELALLFSVIVGGFLGLIGLYKVLMHKES